MTELSRSAIKMGNAELADQIAETAVGELVKVPCDSSGGRLHAVWLPSAELFFELAPLRHFSSTALIHGSSGQIWIVSMKNHPWTADLVSKVDDFLSRQFEALSWTHLEAALAYNLEHTVVLHRECLLDGQLSLLKIPCLADAIIRRWISTQESLPEVAELRAIKSELIRRIQMSADISVANFFRHVKSNISSTTFQHSLQLVRYNYLANVTHKKARIQFASTYPLLADLVFSADAKSLWRDLGRAVDGLRSPVLFLRKALAVSSASVRALGGVTAAEVGEYFQQHPDELLHMLDALPSEYLPKSREHWQLLTQQYEVAKQFFGRSPSGSVLVRARVAHSMRFAVQFNQSEVQLNQVDLHKVERLRAGLVQATHSYCGDQKNQTLDINRRARISQLIDRFLGRLSWSRLLECSRKFEKCYAEAVEKNLDIINFISSSKYCDFCPDGGKFVSANGWSVLCLSSVAELEAHGLLLDNCLATTGHRSLFHAECMLGKTVIFAIIDQHGRTRSTAEFHVSIVKSAAMDSAVSFQLVQHTGNRNQTPGRESTDTLESLRAQFHSPVWQKHARTGLRNIRLRTTYSIQNSETTAAYFMSSLEAFRATFKAKAEMLLGQFSEVNEQST